MTHGSIYIPFRRTTHQLLFCEAWSDGHIDYVGLGVLNSSGHIHEVAALSELFVGSPFFYYPAKQEYFSKEPDDIVDSFYDFIIHPYLSYENGRSVISLEQTKKDEYENIIKSAQESLTLVLEGKTQEAFNTSFGQMSFEEKVALNLANNNGVVDADEEWKKFTSESVLLPQDELFDFLIEQLKQIDDPTSDNLEDLDTEAFHEYVWKDNQFWSALYIDEQEYISPLIINCALFCDTDQGYIPHITPTDRATLDAFKAKLIENNMPLSLLFKGNVAI